MEIDIGTRIRIKPEALCGYPDVDYTVVTVTEMHVGLTSDDFDPKDKDTIVQLAVKKEHVQEVISPVSNADISSTPVPNVTNIQHF